jgi:hypothetical protein
MPQFIEFNYQSYSFFDEEPERDIRPIQAFNLMTVHIPSDAISFSLINAKNIEQAYEIPEDDKELYYVAHPENIFTTQQIRDYGPEHTLHIEQLFDEIDKTNNPDTDDDTQENHITSTTTIDNIDEMMRNFLSPNSSGQVMMDFMANSMEQHGCHRVMGDPPHYCIGIPDTATIIDRKSRVVISYPLA